MVDSWMDVDVRYMKRLPVMNIFRNQAQQVQAVALTKHFWSSFTWCSLHATGVLLCDMGLIWFLIGQAVLFPQSSRFLGNVLLVDLMVVLLFWYNIDQRPPRLIALFDFHVKHVKFEDPARTLMVDSWMDVDVRYMKRLPVMNIFRNQAQQVQAVALTKHFWSSFTWCSLHATGGLWCDMGLIWFWIRLALLFPHSCRSFLLAYQTDNCSWLLFMYLSACPVRLLLFFGFFRVQSCGKLRAQWMFNMLGLLVFFFLYNIDLRPQA